ncbi:hypothetical protein [Oerskovia paurometabola]|uniref:Uncharacterized protein n=1 Tax=Oerskovia paurometabola TaxID=162170 RepID=A0ABW1X6M3_9CELL|nr:hypothetical protein [Oerskovia paurometabola]MBM7496311.1 hypothetical protein [Oerskovia paurometabola]
MSTPQGTRPPTGPTPGQGRPAGSGAAASGRPTSRTLRVRRVMALVLLAVIVVGVVMLVKAAIAFGAGLLADEPQGKVAPPAPQEVTATGYKACKAKDVTLSLTVSKTQYAVGEQPSFTTTLTHVGPRPCLIDASSAVQEITITSGTDRIWSSADCPAPSKDLLMAPGDVWPETLTWNRDRSAPGCPTGLPATQAGSYSAVAASNEAEGLTSPAVPFTLVAPAPPPEAPASEAPTEGEPPTDGTAQVPAEGAEPPAGGAAAPEDGTGTPAGDAPPQG